MSRVGLRIQRLTAAVIARIAASIHNWRWTSMDATVPSSVTLDAIERFLTGAGVGKGATLMVHSSWESLNSGHFSAADLIKQLIAIVGAAGTLAMPAFPHHSSQKDGAHFDVKRNPSAGGLLTEIFRRYPGVSRSINLSHSVCAIGPFAEFLTKDHHRSETAWDRYSPYYRLGEIQNSWSIGLGVGHRLKIATSLHCVDSALWKENTYFRKLFREQISYSYKTTKGETGNHCYKKRSGQIYTPKLAKYFTTDELIEDTIMGLEVYAIRAKILIDKATALGRKGKTMYVWPIPFPWYFKR